MCSREKPRPRSIGRRRAGQTPGVWGPEFRPRARKRKGTVQKKASPRCYRFREGRERALFFRKHQPRRRELGESAVGESGLLSPFSPVTLERSAGL